MGWFGGKKKPKRKPPVLEPVGTPAVQAAPAVQPVQANSDIPSIQAAPAAQQPIVEVAPVGTVADANVMVSAEPVVSSSPPAQAPTPTGWAKKSEKPLLDIHKRLDHMMDSKGKSLEDRYQDRFGDQLPESVATDSARKDYNEKKTNKPNIVFKPRSKLKLTPKKMTGKKDEEKPAPKIETEEKKTTMPKSRGSKTKAAIGSAGSAVGRGAGAITSGIGKGAGAVKSGIGRGAGAVKSGIGRGASSVMGLFGRGSKEEKSKSRKTTTGTDYSSMKLPELRAALKKKGLPTSGNKAALIKRLKK
jgi:hypothetical protein